MKSETSTTANRALLLIDLQNDFVDGGALAVPGGLEVVDVANALMPKFDCVVATQDWHPADHQSFASQHAAMAVGDCFQLGGLPQIAWPDHCIQQTHGAEFVASLNRDQIDQVVRKGTNKQIDSYSAFYDNGHLQSTGLADEFRRRGVEHLFAMGLATDYCVRATVLDALAEGFRVTLVVDGCRGVELETGDVQRSLEEMQAAGAVLVYSDDVS
ncbi:bifunctional nicotinamidase/pyrazinamidase [Stieleria mannarensis]|uniref:bifunctional nicotinamidase/pyrazinamidase n=1 Tax=Stieleria mannarensis TaxID=2755585 RepID=UPI0025707087|nr:bifunctional nicotinamidase/pyrazinamidase [Rhodopirellula sp. JC639]